MMAGLAVGGAALPAAAAKDAEEIRLTVENPGEPVPLLQDEAGRYFFRVTVEGEVSAFVASWERMSDGELWQPKHVPLALQQMPRCLEHEWRQILKPFTSKRQMMRSKKWTWKGERIAGLADKKSRAALDACVDVWGEAAADLEWAADKKSLTVTIPVDLVGPGTHEVWITTLDRKKHRVEGAVGPYYLLSMEQNVFTQGPTAKLTVEVPDLPFDRDTPDGTPAGTRSWFAPTSFSALTPLPWGPPRGGAAATGGAREGDTAGARSGGGGAQTEDAPAADSTAKAEDDDAKPTIAVGKVVPVVHAAPVQETAGWVAPRQPTNLLGAVVGGLVLALLVAVPSWLLERGAARGDGRVARLVRASYAPPRQPSDAHDERPGERPAPAQTTTIEGEDRA